MSVSIRSPSLSRLATRISGCTTKTPPKNYSAKHFPYGAAENQLPRGKPNKNTMQKKNRRTKVKGDSTASTVPSAEAHPSDQPEPTRTEKGSRNNENVTPKRDGILDDSVPLNLYRASPTITHGRSAEQMDSINELADETTKGWEKRFRKIHFEKFPGSHGGDFQLLFFRKSIFVSADDVARALTYLASSCIEYTATEIISALGIRDLIEVPGPEIPTHFEGAERGSYMPLEVLCGVLYRGEMKSDALELANLLDEFTKRQMRHLVATSCDVMLREKMLREEKYSEAKLRSGKQKPWSPEKNPDRPSLEDSIGSPLPAMEI